MEGKTAYDEARLVALAGLASMRRGAPVDAYGNVLDAARSAARADYALLVARLDEVALSIVASSPPQFLPEVSLPPGMVDDALSAMAPRYVTAGPSSGIPARLVGTRAVIPCALDRALVVGRCDGAAFDDDARRFLTEIAELLGTLVRLDAAEQEADLVRARVDAVVETLQHAIVFVEDHGGFAWLNRSAAELLGTEAGDVAPEVLTRAMADLARWTDDPAGNTARTAAIDRDRGAHVLDWRWVSSTEPRRALAVSTTRTAARERPGRLWLIEDVTVEHFARRVLEEKNVQLEAARVAADAASAAKSSFLAAMSHEIRTPMNAVLGMASLLLDTELTAEQRAYVDTIRVGGDALLGVINDILDFSKIEADALDLDALPFDLRACVDDTLDLLAARAASKRVEIVALVDADLPARLVGDGARIRQVLVNLLSNAVKFTSQGEIVVEVTQQRSRDDRERVEVRASVRDSGIGIPAALQGRLFRPFSQLDASTTRRFGGTGLGLAICSRLVKLMGGRIGFTSVEGQGSTFWFELTLPIAPAVTPSPFSFEPGLAGARVLVVDDSETARRVVDRHVRTWGMNPTLAASADEALAAFDQATHDYRLAIIDLAMPETDGVELTRRLRGTPRGKRLPIIILTASADTDAKHELGALGVRSLLQKPVKRPILYDAIAGALAGEPPASDGPPSRRPDASEFDAALAGRAPLAILLAEDNRVNQRVATLMLSRMGYQADVVGSGVEVLEALSRKAYDVVLMDVHMPEMDGIEATQRIRAGEASRPNVRIVAMTADAMQGDRERCFAAGMNDYVSKPVQAQALRRALERAHRDLRGERGPTPSSTPPDPTSSVRLAASIDPAALERMRELVSRDETEFQDLVDEFLTNGVKLVEDMRRAVARGTRDDLERAAHSLKASAGFFGCADLALRAAELEDAARAGTDDALARFQALEAVFYASRREMDQQRRRA